MSKKAKVCFLLAGLLLIVLAVSQFMFNTWLNINSVLVYLAGALVVVGLLVDYKMYLEFFTMRTTKHGMNMGVMILVVVILLVCVNYLANLHNKSWDVTQEKLNSLSDQSTKVMDGLKNEIEVKVFNKGHESAEEKQKIKQTLNLYSDYSGKIKVRFFNPYVDNEAAMQYLANLPDRETSHSFVFIEYGGKRVRADAPFDEAAITSAMIKATRDGEAKIYFIKGHGEKDIDSEGDQGVKDLVRSLNESSFKVESLSLIDRKEIPKDATAIAIVGPSESYLDAELGWLKEFMQNGGHLFIALDPGQHSNLAAFVKTLGVEFQNNYVITVAPVVGGGPAVVLGRNFDGGSDITKSFPNGASFALFYLASEVKAAPNLPPTLKVVDLVKTDNFSFTMNDLKQKLTQRPKTEVVTLAVEAKGKTEDNKSGKDFQAVVFGDSDFLTNRSLQLGVNRDLGLNSFASLANQKDLLSIRPKLPKGTNLMLTGLARWGIILGGLALPIILFITSGVVWFRRRGA
jgi:ABC-type uncharacterized transport system involved in gliding motility auxiliary subunit